MSASVEESAGSTRVQPVPKSGWLSSSASGISRLIFSVYEHAFCVFIISFQKQLVSEAVSGPSIPVTITAAALSRSSVFISCAATL